MGSIITRELVFSLITPWGHSLPFHYQDNGLPDKFSDTGGSTSKHCLPWTRHYYSSIKGNKVWQRKKCG
jgi:hypothetical protein